MGNTVRTETELLHIFRDHKIGGITAQDMRDFLVSIPGLSLDSGDGDATLASLTVEETLALTGTVSLGGDEGEAGQVLTSGGPGEPCTWEDVAVSSVTANRAVVSNGSGIITASSVTATELGYLSGVTSAIQTQINTKQATITGGATTIATSDLTASRALASDGNGKVVVSSVTDMELGYLSGVTNTIQLQIDDLEASKLSNDAGVITTDGTGNITAASFAGAISADTITSSSLISDGLVAVESGLLVNFGVGSDGEFLVTSGGVPVWSTPAPNTTNILAGDGTGGIVDSGLALPLAPATTNILAGDGLGGIEDSGLTLPIAPATENILIGDGAGGFADGGYALPLAPVTGNILVGDGTGGFADGGYALPLAPATGNILVGDGAGGIADGGLTLPFAPSTTNILVGDGLGGIEDSGLTLPLAPATENILVGDGAGGFADGGYSLPLAPATGNILVGDGTGGFADGGYALPLAPVTANILIGDGAGGFADGGYALPLAPVTGNILVGDGTGGIGDGGLTLPLDFADITGTEAVATISGVAAGDLLMSVDGGTQITSTGFLAPDQDLRTTEAVTFGTVTGTSYIRGGNTTYTELNDVGEILLSGEPGTAGQILTSGGPGAAASWEDTSLGFGDNITDTIFNSVLVTDGSGNLAEGPGWDGASLDLLNQDLNNVTTVNAVTVVADAIQLNNGFTLEADGSIYAGSGYGDAGQVLMSGGSGVAVTWESAPRVYRETVANPSGTITITHDLAQDYVQVTIYDENNKIILPDEITPVSSSQLTIDMTSYGSVSGNWNVVVIG